MIFSSLTNEKSIVYFCEYRISVLKKGIIRIEKSETNFNDYPTQIVLNRNFEFVEFNFKISENEIKISMVDYELVFNGNLDELYVIYKGNKIFLDKSLNMGGTYETVDGMDGEKQTLKGINYQIGDGLCSKNGLSVIDDSNSYCFDENLNFSHINEDVMDVYVFFYPNDYLGAIRDFFEISGYPPKLPKYVFGNWWSRYYAYTQEKYLYLMDSFRYSNIPFTVATIDMDWHYSSSNGRKIMEDLEMLEEEFIKDPNAIDGKYYSPYWNDKDEGSKGWSGYTWNKKLFPNYEQFLKDLHERGLAVTLNLHPADGIAFYDEMYVRCCNRLGLDYTKKDAIPFDFTCEENKKMYFEEITNFYENKGVDFWWIDWQQGSFSKFPGLTPMWLCNHYFYLDREKHTKRPLLLSRFCGIGGHRYPLGFSGDSYQSFDSLKYLVKTTSKASNVGFSYWSHDIGGHMCGVKDGDLYLKFIQFGVFSPILRIHSAPNETFSKEPALFLNGYGEMINRYLRLRHQMIPYIYSFSLRTSLEGRCLLEPLYYHHPEDEKCYEFADGEYYFASDLLVAPFTSRKDKFDLNHKSVYFPNGNFYDLKYGYRYIGNKTYNITRETGDIPVFIKEGAFFILDNNNIGNSIEMPKQLDITTTKGYGEYTLYEDDLNENMIKTTFINKNGSISIRITGERELFIKDRVYKFKVLNEYNSVDVKVLGAKLLNKTNSGGFFEFMICEVEFDKEVIIEIDFSNHSDLELSIKQACNKIMYIDDDNNIRNDVYYSICKSKSLNELKNIILNSKLSENSVNMLLEVI